MKLILLECLQELNILGSQRTDLMEAIVELIKTIDSQMVNEDDSS